MLFNASARMEKVTKCNFVSCEVPNITEISNLFFGTIRIVNISGKQDVMSKKYTQDELKSCSKEMLITLLLSMQDQVERLNQNMENLIKQITIANQKHFGRSTEKLDITDYE